jgi:peptide/nickel transport system substrate-binding protein
MVNKPRWLTLAVTGVVAVLMLVACTPAAGPTTAPTAAATAPAATTAATEAPSATDEATPEATAEATPEGTPEGTPEATPEGTAGATPEPTAYPSPGEQPGAAADITDAYPNYGGAVDCEAGTFNGLPYSGNVESITATDEHTVVFDLCNPDVAFLSKIAFAVFAINDSDYLIEHADAGDLKDNMNGTGPLKLDQWQRGTELDYSRFDDYWGEPAATATAVLKWLTEPASRLQELTAGTTNGITNVGPTDFDVVRNNPELQLLEGGGLNTLYLGMNSNFEPWSDPAVRQAVAIGIDRQRIVDNFMPPGSEVATHFTPCGIPFACTGEAWPDTDVETARQMITDAAGEAGITTTIQYRNVARGYIPLPVETATDFQAQLEAINIHATLEEQESGTFIGNANTGSLSGLFLLGWGADYPDVSNFLDYHFGSGCTSAFGECRPAIYEPLQTGGSTSVEADREAAYAEANDAIRADVPMVPISHAGFANAYQAGVDVAQASPLSNELLYRMAPPGGGDSVVFTQNAEPIGLYCADETDGESLRACEQSMEALYSYEINGTEPIPALATECTPNEDLSVWTCALREGVTFHNGATFEAKDVIASFAAQWDTLSPLHVGNTGVFEYWGGLWGGNLNPSAPCGIPEQPACEE